MLACPRCGHRLKVVTYRRAAAYRCPRCAGHAVTYPVIREAMPRGRWQRLWRKMFAGETPSALKCPGCTRRMGEVRTEALVIDSCRPCGILWFDAGELEALPPAPPPRAAPAPVPVAPDWVAPDVVEPEEERGPPGNPWHLVCGWLGLPFEVSDHRVRRAYVTIGVAVALIAVYVLELQAGLGRTVAAWGFVPAEAGRHGGLTLVTSFFLHAGWVHLFTNAYFLVVFGDNVEEDLGGPWYGLLLLLGALVGCGAHAALDPRSAVPLVGASAGISGVLAYYAFRFPRARIGWAWRFWFVPIWWFRMHARTAFYLWVGLQLLLAWLQRRGLGHVSALGHLGGVLAGLLFVYFRRLEAGPDRHGPR